MDEIVEAALRKWPNVPHCYGWLGLDVRGEGYLRDERAQAAGAFPEVKGSRIEHVKLRQFIERNYASDAAGCWFFQNGPQRVYVELEAAPWIWRLHPHGAHVEVRSHTGLAVDIESAWLDEEGRLFLAGRPGLGIVHTADVELAAGIVDAGRWQPASTRHVELLERFGVRLSPAALNAGGAAAPPGQRGVQPP
jgi:hypothetical protein